MRPWLSTVTSQEDGSEWSLRVLPFTCVGFLWVLDTPSLDVWDDFFQAVLVCVIIVLVQHSRQILKLVLAVFC